MIILRLKGNEIIEGESIIGRVYRKNGGIYIEGGKYNLMIKRSFGKIEVFLEGEKVGRIGEGVMSIGNEEYKFSRPALIAFIRGYSNELLLFHESTNIAKIKRTDNNELELLVDYEEHLLPSLALLLYLSPYTTPAILPKPRVMSQRLRIILLLDIFSILVVIFFIPVLDWYALPIILVLGIIYILIMTGKIPRRKLLF